MPKTTNLYIFSDGHKYYAGKSDNPIERLRQHITEAFSVQSKRYYKKCIHIRTYETPEKAKQHFHLIWTKRIPERGWQQKEVDLIAWCRKEYGYENVLNTTDGGDQVNPRTGEVVHPDETIQYILNNPKNLSVTELAAMFNTSTAYISEVIYGRVRRQPDFEYPEETEPRNRNTYAHGEQMPNHELDWFLVFKIRTNCHLTQLKISFLIHDISRYQPQQQSISKILHNKIWYDENWDEDNREYIGQPLNWEESWGEY